MAGGQNSAVGIATRYGLEGSGFEIRWVRETSIFYTRPDHPWGPFSLLCNGYQGPFRTAKSPRRRVDHAHL